MYDPWGYWRYSHVTGCACSICRPMTTATTATLSYRHVHRCDGWIAAMALAASLRATGQCSGKPRVRSLGEQWEVSWMPVYFVTNA